MICEFRIRIFFVMCFYGLPMCYCWWVLSQGGSGGLLVV